MADLLFLGHLLRRLTVRDAGVGFQPQRPPKCLILDVAMPGMSGPELQQELTRRGHTMPIVFITGQHDETVRPRLLARGAAACLFEPFSETALVEALNVALG